MLMCLKAELQYVEICRPSQSREVSGVTRGGADLTAVAVNPKTKDHQILEGPCHPK